MFIPSLYLNSLNRAQKIEKRDEIAPGKDLNMQVGTDGKGTQRKEHEWNARERD